MNSLNKEIKNTTLEIIEVNPYIEKEIEEINFNNINYKPYNGINPEIKKGSKTLNSKDKMYSLIQFNVKPAEKELALLEQEGIKLIEYLGSNTWYVSIRQDLENILEDEGNNIRLKNSKFNNKYLIRSVDSIDPILKKSKIIRENKIGNWVKDKSGNLYLNIQFQKDIRLEEGEKIIKKMNGKTLNRIESINTLTVMISEIDMNNLFSIDGIKFIETISPPSEDKLSESKEQISVDTIHSSPYDLSGNGIVILQYEGKISGDHQDLNGRVMVPRSPFDFGPGSHATHVAGIMIGNGTINGSYKGIAYKASLITYETDYEVWESTYNDTESIESDYLHGISNYNAKLASNSWGIATDPSYCNYHGVYTLVSSLLDEISKSQKFSIVWANGNERTLGCTTNGYGTTLPKASAKNVISVGATTSNNDVSVRFSSSFGPTDAGRIKPDLLATGCVISTDLNDTYTSKCGTSMAAPHVSGTIALMLEQWNKSGYQSSLGDPLPSTIKALLLDSTTDLHRDGSGTQTIDGPDYKNGFGLLNAKEAVDRIIAGTFKEENISGSNDVDVYAINISSQNELKVTLVWDDPAGSILYNDLDLKLISPSGTTYFLGFFIQVLHPNLQQEIMHCLNKIILM